MKKYISIFAIFALLNSCSKSEENAFDLAKLFCKCIVEESNKKDSNLNLINCDSVAFSNSRFFKLRFSENTNADAATMDSANKFVKEVGDIIDTMCFNKPGVTIKKRKLW
jgi:hypothetical protein